MSQGFTGTVPAPELAPVSWEPDVNQTIAANQAATILQTPFILDAGIVVTVLAGGLLDLQGDLPTLYNAPEMLQAWTEPEGNQELRPPMVSTLDQSPLILDAGILVSLDAGSLLNLDTRREDVYRGFVDAFPAVSYTIPSGATETVCGPFVAVSGVMAELATDAVLNIM